MKTLQRMLLFNCIPVFLVAMLFFVMILQMVDLFSNLWRYLNQDVPLSQVLLIQIYYMPKCIAYAVPISLLFAVAYTLGQLYANNELIALLSSGISLRYAVAPLILSGLLLGIGLFFFEDRVVIPTYSRKNELARTLLGERESLNNNNVTIRGDRPGVIYSAEYYNDGNRTLSNVIVILLRPDNSLERRIDARWAEYSNGEWLFHEARVYAPGPEGITESSRPLFSDPLLRDDPDSFRRRQKAVEELTVDEARRYLAELEKAGQESRGVRTEYYRRIAFVFTPFIVAMISAAIGSRFRKNILLMSLLSSLCISVVFYVFQMITGIFATIGLLTPLAGASIPVLVFMAAGFSMLKFIRT